MSVQTMAAVWKGSQHSGSALLMMLAIADFSDDKGVAYPAVSTLAFKTRMKPRNAHYLLCQLQESGELVIKIAAGPKGTNLYRIALDRLHGVQGVAGVQPSAGVQRGAGVQGVAGVQPSARGGAMQCADPLQPSAPEPSLNHQEPPEESASPTSRLPPCPHRQLLALFASRVAGLPQPRVELWTDSAAATSMADRWKWILTAKRGDGERYATTSAEALGWFGRFFDTVSASDFLTGRSGRWTKCSLQWLMKRENFAKVVEGHYANDEVTA